MTQGPVTPRENDDGARRRFLGVIKRDGLKPFVEVPEDIGVDFAPGSRVVGTIGRARFRSVLAPGIAGHRIFVDANVRTRAGVSVGDRVSVIFAADGGSEARELPVELAEALETNPQAKTAFADLSGDRKREILLSLKWAKTDAARARYVKKLVRRLENGWVQ